MRPGTIDQSQAFKRLLTSNSSDLSFAARNMRISAPTTVSNPGLITLTTALEGAATPRWLEFVPFGVGADDGSVQIVVNGYSPVLTGTTTVQWMPKALAHITGTRCQAVGSSDLNVSVAVSTGERFCDTIAITAGCTDVGVSAISPVNNRIGSFKVDVHGHPYIDVTFLSGTSGHDCNVLWRVV